MLPVVPRGPGGRLVSLFTLAVASCTAACSGTVGAGGDPGEGGRTGKGGGTGNRAGGSLIGGNPQSPDSPFNPDVLALHCDNPAIAPGAAPLRRLTNIQLENTLRDLFAAIATPAPLELPPENAIVGYTTIAAGQSSSLALLEGLSGAFESVADLATRTGALEKLAPCANAAAPDPCGRTFIETFGKRAFRRPLSKPESDRLFALFTATRTASDYPTAVRTTVEAMLTAPQFAFRLETGTPGGEAPSGVNKLTGYEVATRLSYLLWDTMPDRALMDAAAAGTLDNTDGIGEQTARLLADPRARPAIARFSAQWLSLGKLVRLDKDAARFPTFNAAVETSMRTAIERFVDHVLWQDDGKVSTLLGDPRAFVDDKLAPIYDVAAPAGGTMQLVDVSGEGKRKGLFTQAGLMAALAKRGEDSPVFRGLFVLDKLLCEAPPEPPADVPAFAEAQPGDPPSTTRERFALTHSPPQCASCHDRIDPIGFAFGSYDAVGKYQSHEQNVLIDTSGTLANTRDSDGDFTGAVQLMDRLSGSTQVRQCFATHFFRYGMGRIESDADSCALKPVVDDFLASAGDLQSLVAAMVRADGFRFVPAATP